MTPASREHRLEAILHAYLQAIDRGDKPDRQAILDAHPDLRDELSEYFADASKFEHLAASLRTVDASAGTPSPTLGTVRYVGDYELLDEIARGGMGVVYRARQVSLNRVVALKMILKGEFASEADVRRFRQEAEAAANLDHPNIVPIYEVGEHEGQQYFSMKLIDGEPGRVSAGSASNTPGAYAARLAKVARAVHHAHQRGILHRDLKPSNILVDATGEPHVADFGLAKKVEGGDDATRSGAIVGTPAYMAPEQARAEKSLTVAVDVYSLGAIMYEWLTGKPPFRGDDALSTLLKVINDEPVSVRSLNPAIDRDLETICHKCLEKDPVKRYASAEALADDLDRWARGEPIEARATTRWEQIVKWTRREPLAAAFALFAIVAMVGFIGLLMYNVVTIDRALKAEQVAKNEAVDSATRAALREADAVQAGKRAAEDRDQAESLRLVAESSIARSADPGLGLLLSLAATERAPQVGPLHRNAVVASWQQCRELKTYAEPLLTPLDTFQDHISFTNVAVSKDGKRLATLSDRLLWTGGSAGFGYTLKPEAFRHRAVQIRDASTGQVQAVVRIPGMLFHSAHFNPDGKTLATLSEGLLTAYPKSAEPRGPLQGFRFTDWTVRLWDTSTGKELHVLKGHQGRVVTLDFSPDGTMLATGSWDHTVRLWDVTTGRQMHVLQPEKVNFLDGRGVAVTQVSFSPDGRRLLTLTDGCQTGIAGKLPYFKEFLDKMDPPAHVVEDTIKANTQPIEQSFNGPYRNQNEDQTPAQLWNPATGQLLATLSPEKNAPLEPTTWAGFAPDGGLLTGHWRGNLNRWSRDGKFETRWPAADGSQEGEGTRAPVAAVAFSADGKQACIVHAAIGPFEPHSRREAHYRPTIVIRDHATGKVAARWHEANKLRLLRFNADASLVLSLATQSEDTDAASPELQVRRTTTGDLIAELRGHHGQIAAAEFLPDGQRVVSVGIDGTVRLWQADGVPVGGLLLRHESNSIRGLLLQPQGRQLVTFARPLNAGHRFHEPWPGERRATVWDASDGKRIAELRGLAGIADARLRDFAQGNVLHAEYTRDGTAIVTVAKDWIVDAVPKVIEKPAYEPVRIWDARTFEQRFALNGLGSEVRSASFSPDGRWLLTLSRPTRHVVSLESDRVQGLRSTGETTNQPVREPGVRLWDMATGKLFLVLRDEKHDCYAACWSPDGKRVLIHAGLVSRDYTAVRDYPHLALFDAATGNLTTRLDVVLDSLEQLQFSPDGRWIVGISGTGVEVWDATMGKRVRTLEGHTGDVTTLAFNDDGTLLASGGHDRTVRVFDVASGVLRSTLTGHAARLTALVFSPDGRWLASASEDGVTRIWEATTGQMWMALTGHRGPVRVLAFTADSRSLYTGGDDGTVRSWPVDPLPFARRALPRLLTAEERERFRP